MREKQNSKTLYLSAIAIVLVLAISAQSVLAYFTTYATARGEQALELTFTKTTPHEDVSNWTKEIAIENIGVVECYVRVKVLAGNEFIDGLKFSDPSRQWSPGANGYYYYSEILPPGGLSSQLSVKIDHKGKDQSFNVVVVQECTPVFYDKNGNPYADWTAIFDADGQIKTNED